MNCPSCQHENAPGKSFCEECGGRLTPTCASCGAELSPTAKFCGDCGQAFDAYTPPHLAQKILTQRSALEGERKQVTVLFADVKGSTELAEGLDPEEWHLILDRFFQILTEGVHRFEGHVNQYLGDETIALFGALIAHEDHASQGDR